MRHGLIHDSMRVTVPSSSHVRVREVDEQHRPVVYLCMKHTDLGEGWEVRAEVELPPLHTFTRTRVMVKGGR